MRSFFLYASLPPKIFLFFENVCEYYPNSSDGLSTVFVLTTDDPLPSQNTLISRISSAEKYAIIFLLCQPQKIFLFFEKICEYYQGSSHGLSTVFVLTTEHLILFQNTLISRLSSADHFPFLPSTLRKSSYFLRTYGNIIKVLAMC